MASAVTHLFAAGVLGKTFAVRKMPVRFWALAAFCSLIPDIDLIGYSYGIKYGDLFGHRGFTHSLSFAFLLGMAVVLAAFHATPRFSKAWWLLVGYFFLATASHGFLDAMTDRGLGTGFFIPFDNSRYFLLWRPLHASPLRIARFFSWQGVHIIVSEMLWVWIPLLLFSAGVWGYRKKRGPVGDPSPSLY